jgi:hypothetical protein
MSTMKSERRPGPGVEPVDQAPEEVVDRLAELLPEGVLDEAVRGLRPEELSGPGRLDHLGSGPAYRFADFATLTAVIPAGGAGVYTIWDENDELVYVGVAGRNPHGRAFGPGWPGFGGRRSP